MGRNKLVLMATGISAAFLLVGATPVAAGGPGGHGGGGGGYGGGGYHGGGDFHEGGDYRGFGYRGYGYGYGYFGYGYLDFDPGYPPPAYPIYPPPVVVTIVPTVPPAPPSPFLPAPIDNKAQIRVLVPADAILWFDGALTNQAGPERVFVTPALIPGKDFHYSIKAQWLQAGLPVERTIRITVRADQTTIADFHALPAPRG